MKVISGNIIKVINEGDFWTFFVTYSASTSDHVAYPAWGTEIDFLKSVYVPDDFQMKK